MRKMPEYPKAPSVPTQEEINTYAKALENRYKRDTVDFELIYIIILLGIFLWLLYEICFVQ